MTPVGAAPQVSDDLIDLAHLHAVEFHDSPEENKKKIKAFLKAQHLHNSFDAPYVASLLFRGDELETEADS